MKLTQAQIIELLKSVGVQAVEVVEDEAQSEFDMELAIQAIDGNRMAINRPSIESELTDRITASIAGKSAGTLRSALSQLTGIDKNQLKDLKDNEAIKMAMEHYGKSLDASKEDVQKMISELTELKDREHQEALAPVMAERDSWKSKYIDRDILSAIANELKSAPIPKNADRDVVAMDFKRHIAEKYNLTYDEVGKALNLFQKDKPTLPAMNGSLPIKLIDEAKEFLTPRNLWETDTRHQNAAAATNQNATATYTPPQGQSTNPIQQLNQAMQQMAAQNGLTK